MNKEEFVKECFERGYCPRWRAQQYAKVYKKDKYDEKDLEAAYRMDQQSEYREENEKTLIINNW